MDIANAVSLLTVVVALLSVAVSWRRASTERKRSEAKLAAEHKRADERVQHERAQLKIQVAQAASELLDDYRAEVGRLRVLLREEETARQTLRQDLNVAMLRISQLEERNGVLEAQLRSLLSTLERGDDE